MKPIPNTGLVKIKGIVAPAFLGGSSKLITCFIMKMVKSVGEFGLVSGDGM